MSNEGNGQVDFCPNQFLCTSILGRTKVSLVVGAVETAARSTVWAFPDSAAWFALSAVTDDANVRKSIITFIFV